MPQENTATIFREFLRSTAKNLDKAAIYYKQGSSYIPLSYRGLLLQSHYLGPLLDRHEIHKRDHVAIVLENSPWWPVAYFALMQRGAIAVPLYAQAEPAELEYLLRHSDTKLIITSSTTEPRIEGTARSAGIPLLTLEVPFHTETLPDDFHEPANAQVAPEDTAMIMYTSGTADTPKGVMLSHKNLLADVRALIQLNLMHPEDCFPSMLPLHHSYPFMVNLLLPLLGGASVSFVAALEAEEFYACIAQTPTDGIAAVPRLLSHLHEKISAGIAKKTATKKILLHAILACAHLLPRATRINLTKYLLRGLHQKFGSAFRLMISGGAKLDIAIAKDFDTWGFLVLEGYGLTEASPVVCFNTPAHAKLGSVGRPLEGVTVTIDSPDARGIGEICIAGENLTSGYYKDPQYTAQMIRHGTLFTQDLGWIDKDGYVFITGRKNETIVLSSGKKINPEELEAHYLKSPYIREICISSCTQEAQKDVLIALIVPDPAAKHRIRETLEAYSKTLPAYKRVLRFIISDEPLPKTLLGKIRRSEVAKKLNPPSCLGAQGHVKDLSAEDQALVHFALCQKALEYLTQKAKKKVYPGNHLELDLGLDSLERINLFFEFQKLSGKTLDETLFFHMATVRDALNALLMASGQLPPKPETTSWHAALNAPPEKEIVRQVKLSFGVLLNLAKLSVIAAVSGATHSYFWLKVKGKHNIPLQGPFILAANHTSNLDPYLIGISLPFRVIFRSYYLGNQDRLDNPMVAWTKHILNTIGIDPHTNFTKSLQLCAYVLRNGKALCIFPEGALSHNGQIQGFKPGVGILIKELGVPVVPVRIEGAFEVWPGNRIFPLPGRITVTFGAPLTSEELFRAGKDDIDIYQNIAHNLRDEIIKL